MQGWCPGANCVVFRYASERVTIIHWLSPEIGDHSPLDADEFRVLPADLEDGVGGRDIEEAAHVHGPTLVSRDLVLHRVGPGKLADLDGLLRLHDAGSDPRTPHGSP